MYFLFIVPYKMLKKISYKINCVSSSLKKNTKQNLYLKNHLRKNCHHLMIKAKQNISKTPGVEMKAQRKEDNVLWQRETLWEQCLLTKIINSESASH